MGTLDDAPFLWNSGIWMNPGRFYMPSITFESVIRGNVIEIPEKYRTDFSSPVSVTIAFGQSAGRHTPNTKTIAAMQEAKEIEDDVSVKAYSGTDELFADLDAACSK
jgi:hypothetical protein